VKNPIKYIYRVADEFCYIKKLKQFVFQCMEFIFLLFMLKLVQFY